MDWLEQYAKANDPGEKIPGCITCPRSTTQAKPRRGRHGRIKTKQRTLPPWQAKQENGVYCYTPRRVDYGLRRKGTNEHD